MKILGERQWQQRGVAKDRFIFVTGKAGLVLLRTGCHCCCSVTKSCTTLWPHGLQHSRLPYPSPSLGICSNSRPLSGWCHTTILSFVAHFSASPISPRSFSASGSFPVSQLFASRIWSFSFSISPFSEYSRLISFRIDWFDLLAVQGCFKGHSAFCMVQLSHWYVTTGKTIALTIPLFCVSIGGFLKDCILVFKGFPGGAEVKASACNVGDLGLIPGSGRSPGEGNGTPLQYSCL